MSDELKNMTADEQAFWDAAAIAAMAAMVNSFRRNLRGVENAQNDTEGDLMCPDRAMLIDTNGVSGQHDGAMEVASDASVLADAMLDTRRERQQAPSPQPAPTTDDGWVSVEDRLPEIHRVVGVIFDNSTQLCGALSTQNTWINPTTASRFSCRVTHWRELPAPPK